MIPVDIAALVHTLWLGKCFSKWGVWSCSMLQHGECFEHGVCWVLVPRCTFSAVPKGQTLETVLKYSLSGLVVTCHPFVPLISNGAFKLIVSIENAMSRVISSVPNKDDRRHGEAATLPVNAVICVLLGETLAARLSWVMLRGGGAQGRSEHRQGLPVTES